MTVYPGLGGALPERLRPSARRIARTGGRVAVLLDRVDDLVLPAVARLVVVPVDRAGDGAHALVTRARSRLGVPPAGPDDARGPALPFVDALRRNGLIARGTRVGVLVAVGAIVVSAAAATLQGPVPDRVSYPPAAPPPGSAGAAGTGVGAPQATLRVGPYPGDDVPAYVADTRSRLDVLASAAPDADLFAVVSFTGYRSAHDLLDMLSAFRVHRVYLRVPPGGEVLEAAVHDPVADVDAAYARAADAAARRAQDAAEPEAHSRALQEASALGGRCPCLFGAAVRAPAGRLSELAGRGEVRVVDVAPPGSALATSAFVPLEPERQ